MTFPIILNESKNFDNFQAGQDRQKTTKLTIVVFKLIYKLLEWLVPNEIGKKLVKMCIIKMNKVIPCYKTTLHIYAMLANKCLGVEKSNGIISAKNLINCLPQSSVSSSLLFSIDQIKYGDNSCHLGVIG